MTRTAVPTLSFVCTLAGVGWGCNALAADAPAASSSASQAASEKIQYAHVFVSDDCPATPIDKPAPRYEASLTGPVGDFFAGVAGDVAKAGLDSVAAALEEVSKQKAFGAEGSTSFDAYTLTLSGSRTQLESAVPGKTNCMYLWVDARPDVKTPHPKGFDEVSFQKFHDDYVAWKNPETKMHLPDPALFVRMSFSSSPEGFSLQPEVIWYAQKLPGAPDKGLPAEIQLTFSVPAADGSSTPFAVSRVKLPAMAPGQIYYWQQLTGYGSPVMPLRPTTGYVDTTKNALDSAYATVATQQASIEGLAVNLQDFDEDHKGAKGKTEAVKAARLVLIRQSRDAEKARAKAEAQANAMWPSASAGKPTTSISLGKTNMTVRFVMVRSENAFGMAIARSISSHSTALGQGVTDALKPQPDWTPAMTAYVSAVDAVTVAQADYTKAMDGTDTTDQLAKLTTLNTKKAAANEAAVTLGKPLPYPDLLSAVHH